MPTRISHVGSIRTIPQFDGDGKLLPNRRLMIDDGAIPAKTDENGNFEIEGLVRNTGYDIMVPGWDAARNQSTNIIRQFFNSGDKEVIDLKQVR